MSYIVIMRPPLGSTHHPNPTHTLSPSPSSPCRLVNKAMYVCIVRVCVCVSFKANCGSATSCLRHGVASVGGGYRLGSGWEEVSCMWNANELKSVQTCDACAVRERVPPPLRPCHPRNVSNPFSCVALSLSLSACRSHLFRQALWPHSLSLSVAILPPGRTFVCLLLLYAKRNNKR